MRTRTRWLFALLFVLLGGLFARLGIWQLARAGEAETLAESVKERTQQPPLELHDIDIDVEANAYRHLVLRGSFEQDGYILLDNRKQDGRNGYHLVVPFRLAGNEQRVMVNKGWLTREQKEPIPTVDASQVTGLLVEPARPAMRLGGEAEWSTVWPWLDVERLEQQRGYPVGRFMVVADPRLVGETLERVAGAEDRSGMHIGYAIQWFAFSAMAMVLTVMVFRRQPESKQ